jgi:hypothetical protein
LANVPFPISGDTLEDVRYQIYELIRTLYEEKIGGADLGDVFSIVGDVFTLALATASGLTKTGNELAIDPVSTGGLQVATTGASIKILSTGGLETDATGLGIKLDGASLSVGGSGLKLTDPLTLGNVTLDNDGLHLLDTNASHDLIISPGSDLTADRTLTLVTGDSDRTLTLANIDTLTDDSMADALHRHSELSASDGSPNPALSVSADGYVKLHHSAGIIYSDGHIYMGLDSDNSGTGLNFVIYHDGNTSNILFQVQDNGNVGIGTSAPDSTLEVNAAAGGELRLTYNDSDGSATDYSTLGVGANGLTTLTTVDSDGALGHIALMPDGNVGIGTASPARPLDVGGTGTVSKFGTDPVAIEIGTPTTVSGFLCGYYTAGGNKSSVFLGQNSCFDGVWRFPNAGGATSTFFMYDGSYIWYTSAVASIGTIKMSLSNAGDLMVSGKLGIGTANPATKLDVQGDINIVCQADQVVCHDDTMVYS